MTWHAIWSIEVFLYSTAVYIGVGSGIYMFSFPSPEHLRDTRVAVNPLPSDFSDNAQAVAIGLLVIMWPIVSLYWLYRGVRLLVRGLGKICIGVFHMCRNVAAGFVDLFVGVKRRLRKNRAKLPVARLVRHDGH